MTKVYRYAIPIVTGDCCPVELPGNAKLLTVEVQNAQLFLLALADPSSSLVRRVFRVAQTEQAIDENLDELHYIASCDLLGSLVHLFEVKR
jgi:hypothetical protein